MSNHAKEVLLKSIRENTGKLLTDGTDQQAFKAIKYYIDKGVNYSFYVLSELFDFQSKNAASLSSEAWKAIYELIELAIFTNPTKVDQDTIVIKLMNIVDSKQETKTVERIVKILNKNNGIHLIQLKKQSIMFDLAETLLTFAPLKTDKKIVPFLVPYFKAGAADDSFLRKMITSCKRMMKTAAIKHRWEIACDLMQSILIDCEFELESSKVLDEMYEIFTFVARYGYLDSSVMKTSSNLAKKLLQSCDLMSAANGFRAFDFLFRFCGEKSIDEDLLKQMTSAFKKLDKSDLHHQKIARALTKASITYASNINKTEEAFRSFHNLSVTMFHLLASIKNEAGVYDCCASVKRHEIANHITTIIICAVDFVKEQTLTSSVANHIKYHLSYFIKIMSELTCATKDTDMTRMYNRVYNILYDSIGKKDNISNIRSIVEHFFLIMDASSPEVFESLQDPFSLIHSLYDQAKCEDSTDLSIEFATGMACLFKYMANRKTYDAKSLMKTALQVYKSAQLAGFSSGTDFIKHSEFKKLDFMKGPKIDIEYFTQIEICALTRYTQDSEVSAKLFNELSLNTENFESLANCICLLDEKNVDKLDMKQYKNILKRLEKCPKFTVEVSLALAIGNYYIYIKMDAQYRASSSTKTFENLNLKSELEMLDHLVKGQKYFTDVIVHLKENPEELKQIISMQRLVSVINNMAIQFYMRGVRLKEIETFTILWYFIHLDKPNPNKVLNTATFFIDNYQLLLDNSGNYLKFSKKLKPLTIEEVIVTSNKIVQEEIKEFRNATEEFQCIVLSYLISAWLFYFKKNRKADALEQFDLLKQLWNKSQKPVDSDPRNAVTSKLYFALFDANLVNFNRRADNFMSKANGFLLNSKNIGNEFCHQFYQIFYRVTMSNINYTLNRHNDLDHYETTIQSMIAMAQKKNYCLKILELLSLSILRNLNMEKTDLAQNQLRNISLVLGLNEDILIESPVKTKEQLEVTPTKFYGVAGSRNIVPIETEGIRKALVVSDGPVNLELSIRHVDRADLLLDQLKSFVHEDSCKCDSCQYPQLKFYSFQVGCFYSRLLYLLKKYDVSSNFHKYAIEPWRDVCDKLRRVKEYDNFLMINKSEFHIFSIRWLFQFADTLILKKEYELVDEVYQEIDLLLNNNIDDAECFRQTLFCRKENLNFLLEHHKKFEQPEGDNQLNYLDFLKTRQKPDSTPSKSPITPTELPQKTVKIKVTKPDEHAKSTSKTPAGHVKVKVKKTSEIKSTSSVTDRAKPKKVGPVIYIDCSSEDDTPPVVAAKSKTRNPGSATSSSSTSSSTKTASRSKASDQTPKVKKSSKDDKSEAAKKSTRPKMI